MNLAIRWAQRVGVLQLWFAMLLCVSTAEGQITPKNMSLGPEAARKCAEQGDADCQAKLGYFYDNGKDGVEEDHVQAIKWYRLAAEQGLVAAQMALASTYENGYHVPQNYAAAAKWYQMAAERSNVDAQSKTALSFWTGRGVPKNLVRAHMWANLAAAGEQSRYQDKINAITAGPGTPEEKQNLIQILRDSRQEPVKSAADVREAIEREMTPAQIAEAQRLAREWQPHEVSTTPAAGTATPVPATFAKKASVDWLSAKVLSQDMETERFGSASLPIGTAVVNVPLSRTSNTVVVDTGDQIVTWVEITKKGRITLPVNGWIRYYLEKGIPTVLDSAGKKHVFSI